MLKREVVIVPNSTGMSRDAGKRFLITEMPAARAEKWAARALLLLQNNGATIPMHMAGLGAVGVMILGLNIFLQGNIRFVDLEPLMDEMFTCVKMVRDPKAVDALTGGPVATEIATDEDIEDVATRAWLRSEVLRIHTNFSPAEALSQLISAIQTSGGSSTT